ncbi:MAG: hypothetical protein KJ011_03260 [Burkholderiaceae bacterium]|nr:hypothetical protein [Burkholderiaceae bacterium]
MTKVDVIDEQLVRELIHAQLEAEQLDRNDALHAPAAALIQSIAQAVGLQVVLSSVDPRSTFTRALADAAGVYA